MDVLLTQLELNVVYTNHKRKGRLLKLIPQIKKWVFPKHPDILNAQNNRVLPIHVSVLLKDKLILQSTSPSCKTRKGILEKYVAYFLLDSLLFCFSLSYLCGRTIMS